MAELLKGQSSFYPNQPVPVELFVERKEQIVNNAPKLKKIRPLKLSLSEAIIKARRTGS